MNASSVDSGKLVLGSRNPGKLREIRGLLEPYRIPVVGLSEIPDVPEVVEDGTSFAENAAKKAGEVARFTGCWCIGEDSGLEVDALDGAPGIYSARFSGPQAGDDDNNRLLLERLQDVPDARRGARYVCHVALADPGGEIVASVEATCRGRISREPRGTNGFGYDPYFIIPEYHRTFGELSPLVKQHLSHRARAFQRFIPKLLAALRT